MLDYDNVLDDYTTIVVMNNKEKYILTDYDWAHVSTGKESPGLAFDTNYPIFPPAQFGRRLVVVIQCWIDMGEEMDELTLLSNSGFGIVQFFVNVPPDASDVSIRASPSEGAALATSFALTCEGGSTQMLPLRYSIGYLVADLDERQASSTIEKTIKLAAKCSWITIRGVTIPENYIFSRD